MRKLLRPVSLLFVLSALATNPSAAQSAPQELVDSSKYVVERLVNHPDFTRLKYSLANAKAVLIIPSLLKAGFILGAEGGSGVLLTRDANGEWSYPAFYSMGAGSFGLQAGFQDSEVVFVILTIDGLNAVLNNNVKLGLDASVAAGPVGQGIEGSTTTSLGADIVAYSKNRGLFGGGAFEGAVVYERDDLNRAYYDVGASARSIVMDRQFTNVGAEALRSVLVVQP